MPANCPFKQMAGAVSACEQRSFLPDGGRQYAVAESRQLLALALDRTLTVIPRVERSVLFGFDQNYATNPTVLVGVPKQSVLTAYQALRDFPPNPLDEPGKDVH